MGKMKNCPNCGASEIKDGKCAYCGSVLDIGISESARLELKMAKLALECEISNTKQKIEMINLLNNLL